MWNFKCSNKTCEKFDSFRTHKEHIERLYQTKTMIDNKAPKTPKFLQERAKKEAMEKERNRKIDYENKVLFNKMKEIEYKPSPYSASKVKPFECPAFDKSISGYNMQKKQKDITKANKKLKSRFTNTKTFYSTFGFLRDRQYNLYLESNLSENRMNPYINYATLSQFKNNLGITIEREVAQETVYIPDLGLDNDKNDEAYHTFTLTQTQSRPISSRTFSKDYKKLVPSKTKMTMTTNSNTLSI